MATRRPGIAYIEDFEIEPTNLPKVRVEEYAAEVAKAYSFGIGGDPSSLAEKLGGRIDYQGIEEWLDESGSIFVHGSGDFDILLPRYTHPLRDRFTVAHELGHYFLHSDQGTRPIVAYRSGSTRIEWEANWFAAALLMPKVEFSAEYQRHGSVSLVARKFGVSESAAEVRKNALALRREHP